MKTMPNFLLFIITLALLAACTPIPTPTTLPITTTTATSAPSFSQIPINNTPAPSTTPIFATNTPEPSPTPLPHYEINDPAIWPQEMQDYWNGGDEQWSNPALSAEFDAFILQERRENVAENGIAGVETMSDQEILYQYMRLGQEHGGELLTFSPTELRDMNYRTLNRYVTHYAHSDNTTGNYMFYEGIYLGVVPGNGVMDINLYNDTVSRQGNFRNIINGLNIFGVEQNDLMPGYYGFVGDGAARFRLPGGVSPEVSQGLLGHVFHNNEHFFLPTIVSFQEVPLNAGDLIVNGNEKLVPLEQNDAIRYSRAELAHNPGGISAQPLTEVELISLIGNKITFRSDSFLVSGLGVTSYFPHGLGLQGATTDVRVITANDGVIWSGQTVWPWSL